jgi:hypothetical protein
MGTPVAVSLANIFLEVVELQIPGRCMQLSKHKCEPVFYRRFIDDGVAIFNSSQDARTFVQAFNSLRDGIHITDVLSDSSAIFLDFEIWKGEGPQRGKLETKLFQKPTNRYLYLPFSSFHQPTVFKSFVAAELNRYRIRCSRQADFQHFRGLFASRLEARGYPQSSTTTIREAQFARPEVLEKLRQKRASIGTIAETKAPLVFKTTFSPRHQAIQLSQCLNNTLAARWDVHFDEIFGTRAAPVVCYRRPPNLGDMLIRSRHQLLTPIP